MSDLELLKVYLREQIDITGNKKFVFEECNAIEFRLTDAINEINELQKELCGKKEKEQEIERLNKGYCKFKEQCGKYAMCLRENQLKEIERLNGKLSLIKGIIRTPRALDGSLAYAMVKTQIENILGSDKE